MYKYVTNKDFLNKSKNFSLELIKKLRNLLEKEGIRVSKLMLVGSSKRNLITTLKTKNKENSIDFDFNLEIGKTTLTPKELKNKVRVLFNKVLRNYNLLDCDDSTSSLTTKKIYFGSDNKNEFSIDICITKNENDSIYRLIYRKTNNVYVWKKMIDLSKFYQKFNMVKEIDNIWNQIRKIYLEKKNIYLKQNNHTHPSYICFIETINELYNKYYTK